MSEDDPKTVKTVGRISAPKASDVLADELRGRIRSGEWPEGLTFPPERELAQQTGLSRTSVREALRMLEIDGLIEIRPGRNGGARVRRPAGDELNRQLELFIWGRNLSSEHLHEVRECLEAQAAHAAALRRTDEDLVDLAARTTAVEVAVDDVSRYLEANLEWHIAVARASHNELLIRFMNVLSRSIHRATESEAFNSAETRQSTLSIHRSILAAIIDGDADAARRRMGRHVAAAHDVVKSWTRGGNVNGETAHRAPLKQDRASPRKPTGKRSGTAKEAM
jgi:DNA-binding FadR family transcriptional regulator